MSRAIVDCFIIAVTTGAGLAFHGWLYALFQRWADRDLALSLAGSDPDRRASVLQRLEASRELKVKRRDLRAWLEAELARHNAAASKTRP